MENDDDFTFCQVGSISDRDGFVEENVGAGVGGLTIRDEGSDASSGNQGSGTASGGNHERTVGSLSFSVISASAARKPGEPSGEVASGSHESSDKKSEERKAPAKKPVGRGKVPFEKGYSPMDWLKLTRTHPDLAGLKGESNRRLITMNEVKQHQSKGSMWTVLKGRVYNLSPYLKFHPGGVDILMQAVGKDCTSLFNKYHAWVNAEFLLEKCLVGTLDDGQ